MDLLIEKNEYPLKEETYKIIGIAMEIHRELGKGFSEIVYKDAFEHEFKQQGIYFERKNTRLIIKSKYWHIGSMQIL